MVSSFFGSKFSLFETTNRYKLEFSKGLTNKMQGKMITIAKGNTKIKMLVNTDDEKYRIIRNESR